MPRLTFRHRGYTQHSRRTDAPQCTPPIRTFTVGTGIPPAQPPRSMRAGRGLSPPVRTFTDPGVLACHCATRSRGAARGVRCARTGRGSAPSRSCAQSRSVSVGVRELAQRLHLAVGVLRAEHRRARDKVIGTSDGRALDGRARDPAVHLNRDLQAGGVNGRRGCAQSWGSSAR